MKELTFSEFYGTSGYLSIKSIYILPHTSVVTLSHAK